MFRFFLVLKYWICLVFLVKKKIVWLFRLLMCEKIWRKKKKSYLFIYYKNMGRNILSIKIIIVVLIINMFFNYLLFINIVIGYFYVYVFYRN